MKKYSNQIVMFLGLSIALGGFFQDFRNNQELILSITFSAVCFSVFDLVASINEKSYFSQKVLLFLGIFSVIVVPYLKSISPFLVAHNNFFTLYGLAVVIFLIGFRQHKEEIENFKSLKERFDKQTGIIKDQNGIIDEQTKIIGVLSAKLKDPHEEERD